MQPITLNNACAWVWEHVLVGKVPTVKMRKDELGPPKPHKMSMLACIINFSYGMGET